MNGKQGSSGYTGCNMGGGSFARKAAAAFLTIVLALSCACGAALAAEPATTEETATLQASGRKTLSGEFDLDIVEPDGGFPILDPQSVSIPTVRPRTVTGNSRVESMTVSKSPLLIATATGGEVVLSIYGPEQYDISLWSSDACLVRTMAFGTNTVRVPNDLLEGGDIRAIMLCGEAGEAISLTMTPNMTGTTISLYNDGMNREYANPTPIMPSEGVYTLQGNAQVEARPFGSMTRLNMKIQSGDQWNTVAATLTGGTDAIYRLDDACCLIAGADFLGAPTYWVVTLAFANEPLEGEFSMSVRTSSRIAGGELVESHVATVSVDVNDADATSFLAAYAASGKMLGTIQLGNTVEHEINLEEQFGATTKIDTVKIFLLGAGFMPLLPPIATRIA